jgi:hypothetical protein
VARATVDEPTFALGRRRRLMTIESYGWQASLRFWREEMTRLEPTTRRPTGRP